MNDSDLRFRVAATRALWAVGVLEKARLGKTKAAQLFRKGDLRSAARVVTQFYGTYFGSTFVFPTSRADYSSTLEAGLSVSKPLKVQSGVSTTSSAAVVFKDAFELDDADLSRLVSEINTATGEKSAALDNLESLVSVHPDLRSFLAADPDLKALRDIYEFRVLTGVQQPIEVDDLKLPEEHTARPSSDGTARKN